MYTEKETLADVYYEPSKMYKWRDICVRQFDSLKSKLEKVSAQSKMVVVSKKMEQSLLTL